MRKWLLTLSLAMATCPALVHAAAPDETVSLPYTQATPTGDHWLFCQGGMLQQQGNFPLFSQGAQLIINGQQVQQNNAQARRDAANSEVIIDNLTTAGVTVVRHMKFDTATSLVRMVDVLKNTGDKAVNLSVTVQSQYNYNVQSGAVSDAKHKGSALGCTGTSGNQGWPATMEIYTGKRSRLPQPTEFGSTGNNTFAKYTVPVPAGKEVAILHFHGTTGTPQSGEEQINSLDDRKILKDIPRDLRKLIVNFGGADTSVGDLELLRGDLFDVIEVAGGDQFKGTIKLPSYKLTGDFGAIELQADKVIAMFNIGQFKSRQLVVTSDGQVIGGQLEGTAIDLELSSGQVTKIPLSQITRTGYRKRPDEPEGWTLNQPYVTLRSGERFFVELPAAPISFATRYGTLSVDPKSISAIDWQSDESTVHLLTLTDGTTLAGLFVGDQVQVTRAGTTAAVKLESNQLLRWQFKNMDDDDTVGQGPALDTTSGDHFIASLTGPLHVETTFDSLQIAGEQVAHLERLKDSPADVQIKLWDGATVSGRLVEADLPIKTTSGLSMKVPIGLVKEYTQPAPQPPAAVIEQIKTLVGLLNAEDWKQRDRAQEQLISLGMVVVPTLDDLRAAQPTEAQQRIDTIKAQLAGKDKSTPAANPQPGGASGVILNKD